MINLLSKTVLMPRNLFLGEPTIEERAGYKVGRAQQSVRLLIFRFFLDEHILFECMLVIGWKDDPHAVTLLSHDRIGKSPVCVWPFQHCGNSQSRCSLKRSKRS